MNYVISRRRLTLVCPFPSLDRNYQPRVIKGGVSPRRGVAPRHLLVNLSILKEKLGSINDHSYFISTSQSTTSTKEVFCSTFTSTSSIAKKDINIALWSNSSPSGMISDSTTSATDSSSPFIASGTHSHPTQSHSHSHSHQSNSQHQQTHLNRQPRPPIVTSPTSSQAGRTRLTRPSPLSKLHQVSDVRQSPQVSSAGLGSASSAGTAISIPGGQRYQQRMSGNISNLETPPTSSSSNYADGKTHISSSSPLPLPLHQQQQLPHLSPPNSPSYGQSDEIARSPCFIHSHLEKHGHLSEWLRKRAESGGSHGGDQWGSGVSQITIDGQGPISAVAAEGSTASKPSSSPVSSSAFCEPNANSNKMASTMSLGSNLNLSANNPLSVSRHSSQSDGSHGMRSADWDTDEEQDDAGFLTRQLAETATGVRELSKQLGRTKVRSNIQNVLIVTKARDNRLIKLTREIAIYLMTRKKGASDNGNGSNGGGSSSSNGRGLVVYVDSQLKSSKRFDAAGIAESHPELFQPYPRRRSSSSASLNTVSGFTSDTTSSRIGLSTPSRRSADQEEGQLRYWTAEMCATSPQLFDFVITLGGDGTVLFTSWLFQRIVPPILPFALGSLGFLTNFDFADYKETINRVLDDGIRVNLRMRFTCTVYRAIAPEENKKKGAKAIKSSGGDILVRQVDKKGWEALEGAHFQHTGPAGPINTCKQKKDKEIMCFSTRPVETFEVLNDLVVDRGPSPYVSLLELFGDDNHLTTVQADGLCIATPTGSTAYSLSAGGSLVHPQIPALLISPICPHTLSFRPMLLPDSMELRVCVPYNSRSTAWASFDGRGRIELKQGDHIKVTASKYPFPTVCADKQSTDWFNSISRTLHWNDREKQKSFVVVEEDRPKHRLSNTHEQPVHGAERDVDLVTVEASKKKAHEGMKETQDMAESVSHAQTDQRGDQHQGPGNQKKQDHTVSAEEAADEEGEEDEEAFDIDDVSVHTSPSLTASISRPQLRTRFTSKQFPRLDAGGSGLKSGVDTPDRFATPYCYPSETISPAHFLGQLDDQLVEACTSNSIGDPLDMIAHDREVGQHEFLQNERSRDTHLMTPDRAGDIAHSSTTPQDSQSQSHVSNGAEPVDNLKTPRPRGRSTRSPVVGTSGSRGHFETEEEDQGGKTKAFAFYGQVSTLA